MKPTLSFFPKYLRGLSVPELAAVTNEVGADTIDIVIREGYGVTPNQIKQELPRFTSELAAEGVRAEFAVTPFDTEHLADEIDLLLLMADHGIRAFRVDYFPLRKDVRTALREARRSMERLAPLCSLSGIRAVYQVHHGSLIQSASAAYQLVRDLPPDAVGIQLDTGNMRIEGYESWDYSIHLLGKYVYSVGIKDVRLPNEWVECGQGQVDWDDLFDSLAEIRFSGHLDLMPFYTEDPSTLKEGLKGEVAFVKQHYARRVEQWERE